tara:strand:+ start:1190 stop:2461 length:1272 start_codon:yes stop_codon:yes gene_type:complete
MTDNFCVVPWVQMATKPIGSARVCCLMTNSSDEMKGVVTNEKGTPYNLGTDSIDEIKNGKKYRDLRLSMLANERHADCTTCWTKEDMGHSSRRKMTNKIYEDTFNYNNAIKVTDKQGYTNYEPSYWDLRFGNLCNLKCVMCHPASSNQWYEDFVLLNNNTRFWDGGKPVDLMKVGKKYKDQGQYNWWDNDFFWKKLESKIPFLKMVYLVGGEPMLIEPHYNFLEKVIISGKAKDVTLEYDTNLTHIHQRALDYWREFKTVLLRISLEDAKDQFNYIRYPANWDSVFENVKIITKELKNVDIRFTTTWQILNCYTILDLLTILEPFKKIVSVRILNDPKYYNCKILPKKIKRDLIKLYRSYNVYTNKTDADVEHCANYLINNYYYTNETDLKSFFAVNKILDKSRKTNWKTTFPQLYSNLEKYE